MIATLLADPEPRKPVSPVSTLVGSTVEPAAPCSSRRSTTSVSATDDRRAGATRSEPVGGSTMVPAAEPGCRRCLHASSAARSTIGARAAPRRCRPLRPTAGPLGPRCAMCGCASRSSTGSGRHRICGLSAARSSSVTCWRSCVIAATVGATSATGRAEGISQQLAGNASARGTGRAGSSPAANSSAATSSARVVGSNARLTAARAHSLQSPTTRAVSGSGGGAVAGREGNAAPANAPFGLTRLRVSEPLDGIAEVVAVLSQAGATIAMALRLERREHRLAVHLRAGDLEPVRPARSAELSNTRAYRTAAVAPTAERLGRTNRSQSPDCAAVPRDRALAHP